MEAAWSSNVHPSCRPMILNARVDGLPAHLPPARLTLARAGATDAAAFNLSSLRSRKIRMAGISFSEFGVFPSSVIPAVPRTVVRCSMGMHPSQWIADMPRQRKDTSPEAILAVEAKRLALRQLYHQVGKRMTWARGQREYKQFWVALKAGVERARYNHIEKGRSGRVYMDEVERIAEVLSCSVDWLMRGGTFDPWLPGTAPKNGK